ncbi:hypothetical protein ACE6HT_13180 [Citrobacter freundii]|uniref:hypothetical protein n=1 Tax=Citrobacter freundii TaxID=546 RepID=UPI0035CFF0F1
MSYFKRRDWFFGVFAVIGLSLYFIFDVDFYAYSWPIKLGIAGFIFSLYLSFVEIPGVFGELAKQREINEKLNDKINDLKDQIRDPGNK